MSDFEREIVNCLNRFFKTRHMQGFAYRARQQKPAGRTIGILVDSLNPKYNLAIECKSIIDKKLYFSQHFPAVKNNLHQVDAVAEFLAATGRAGYLALEFRQEPGTSEAFLLPWPVVVSHFRENKGISIGGARGGIALPRSKAGYVLEDIGPSPG